MSVLQDKDRAALLNSVKETGVFVTCGTKTPNIMVTHWGTMGVLWGREVFILPIRSIKYSYKIVTDTGCFALNVPSSARDMRTEISLCDTMSGFKTNKFETLGLHPKRAKEIDSYIIGECGLIVECKVIATIPPENINCVIPDLFSNKTPHTLFVGEAVKSYRIK
ncbi:MAG: flavin reductase [Clostridiales bacterium]|nr:flavin reductase [Clostridiales bacterium]